MAIARSLSTTELLRCERPAWNRLFVGMGNHAGERCNCYQLLRAVNGNSGSAGWYGGEVDPGDVLSIQWRCENHDKSFTQGILWNSPAHSGMVKHRRLRGEWRSTTLHCRRLLRD